jgi:hypothetical protein
MPALNIDPKQFTPVMLIIFQWRINREIVVNDMF